MIFDFVCTYHMISDKDKDDDDSNRDDSNGDDSNRDDSDLLYKIQLLQAFDLKDFDENKIVEEQNIIFEKWNQHKQIVNLIILLKEKYKLYSNDDIIIFQLLFSYDYFYIFLGCLRELYYNNVISDNNYNTLIKKIKK